MFDLLREIPPVVAEGRLWVENRQSMMARPRLTLAFERRDLPSQQRFIADPAVQTLPAEDAQLDFSHVQPASA